MYTHEHMIEISFQFQHNFKLGKDEEDKFSVVSDFESILTYYCKNRCLQYQSNNRWIELLLPVLSHKLSRAYQLFELIGHVVEIVYFVFFFAMRNEFVWRLIDLP